MTQDEIIKQLQTDDEFVIDFITKNNTEAVLSNMYAMGLVTEESQLSFNNPKVLADELSQILLFTYKSGSEGIEVVRKIISVPYKNENADFEATEGLLNAQKTTNQNGFDWNDALQRTGQIIGIAGGFFGGGSKPNDEIQKEEEKKEDEQNNTILWVVGGVGVVIVIAALFFALSKKGAK